MTEEKGRVVALFSSSYVNKVDKKGRVSVPAPFRAALPRHKFDGIVTFPSFKSNAIESGGIDRLEKMQARLEALNEFSDERESLAMLFADVDQLAFDSEGRVMLSERIREFAGIGETAVFVGQGTTFQIWEPAAFAEARARAREFAKTKGLSLPTAVAGTPAP